MSQNVQFRRIVVRTDLFLSRSNFLSVLFSSRYEDQEGINRSLLKEIHNLSDKVDLAKKAADLEETKAEEKEQRNERKIKRKEGHIHVQADGFFQLMYLLKFTFLLHKHL